MKKVKDTKAEYLERAGLWRRAKSRWLFIIMERELSDDEREWIKSRRIWCESQTK